MVIKKEFPITNQITYLDSGSAMLKPLSVIEAITNFYKTSPFNPHSPDSPLAMQVLNQIETTRKAIATLVKAKPTEIIFNSGATEGLNNLASMIGMTLLPGAEIIVSIYNHDSNVLPWIQIAKVQKLKIIFAKNIVRAITKQTKVIAITQIPNGVGPKANLEKLYKVASAKNIILINDAAQALAQEQVSLQYADAIVLAGNKFYGPTGIGAIAIKKNLLSRLQPVKSGGGTVARFHKVSNFVFKKGLPWYEPGTPNTAGIIGFGAAIDFFYKTKTLVAKTKALAHYAFKQLQSLPGLKLYSTPGALALIFNYKNYPPEDISFKLAYKYAIYVRSGAFCAHLNSKEGGALRVSLGIYNIKADIDKLVKVIQSEDFFTIS